MKVGTKKSAYVDPVLQVYICGEGRDESGNRYVKLGVRGTKKAGD